MASALAAPCGPLPYTLTNGQNADASQVMANFNTLLACVQQAADQAARDNIGLLGLKVAAQEDDAITLVDGFADAFSNEDHVDTASSSNEVYNAVDHYYANGGWNVDTTYAPDTNRTAFNTYGFRNVISAAALSTAGIKLRFTFAAATSGDTFNVASARVYEQASSGDAYDGDGTKNADITFNGGSGSVNISVGQTAVSDEIDCSWFDPAKALVIAFGVTGGSSDDLRTKVTVTDWATYVKAGGSGETDTANVSGYSADSNGMGLFKVEVMVSTDMTLLNDTYTASTAPDSARIVIDHEALDSVTLNTDFTAEVSRNGGTNWTAATLAQEIDNGSGRQILAGSADLSGQPSGTSMQWRLKTFNGKDQRVYGVSLQWAE
ncbi:MAG: hypothetical protein AB7N54_08610 [Alphaproteobacteria bacterium]